MKKNDKKNLQKQQIYLPEENIKIAIDRSICTYAKYNLDACKEF